MELSKNKSAVYSSLSSKKMRQKHRLFLAEGEKCVLDTLGAFELEALIVSEDWLLGNPQIAEEYVGKILTASPSAINKITTLVSPPEVIAVFQLPEDNVSAYDVSKDKLYLMLDGIQDPGNLGTIIRTADWFGIDTIFASKDAVDVFNPKVVQSTMGSLKRVKVIYTDLMDVISSNPEMPVYGMLLEGNNIYESGLDSTHGFIIMGNEGNGISESLRGKISHPLLIPPYNAASHPESLNVAIATAITLSLFRSKSPATSNKQTTTDN